MSQRRGRRSRRRTLCGPGCNRRLRRRASSGGQSARTESCAGWRRCAAAETPLTRPFAQKTDAQAEFACQALPGIAPLMLMVNWKRQAGGIVIVEFPWGTLSCRPVIPLSFFDKIVLRPASAKLELRSRRAARAAERVGEGGQARDEGNLYPGTILTLILSRGGHLAQNSTQNPLSDRETCPPRLKTCVRFHFRKSVKRANASSARSSARLSSAWNWGHAAPIFA